MTDSPDDQGQAPRRAYSRLRLGISAQLETLDGRQRVRLMDLSQGGAHIIVSQPGDIRQAVLTWMHFETFAMVVWGDGSKLGLKFDKLLPLTVLVETRQRAPSVVSDESMSAEQAAREWVAGR
ncbi:MAG TPA: PilZ domain-containing protein [Croceibacterium sp.]|nr:PilZ domain-containing protein [Croceibacterium sp.]